MRFYGWLIFLLLVCYSHAELEIPWSAVTNGGGESHSGVFVLDGSAGQSAARVSQGSGVVLNGGYLAGSCGCVVNLSDLIIICGVWLSDDVQLNLSGGDEINYEDFILLAQNWLEDCPAGWSIK